MKLFLLFFLLFSYSCVSNKKSDINNKNEISLSSEIITFSEFPVNEKVQFTELFNYTKGVPNNIECKDSTLVIINMSRKCDYYCYNYYLKRDKLSSGYLKKGKGPNEALGSFTSGINSSQLWVHDLLKKKVHTINVEEALSENGIKEFKSYDLASDFFHLCLLEDSCYWGVGDYMSKKQITVGNLAKSIEHKYISDYQYIPNDVPSEVFKEAYSSIILSKPDNSKVVLAYRFTDVIEIFDTQSYKKVTIQGPHNFSAKYSIGENPSRKYMEKIKTTRKAYVNGCVTDKYIYLIYAGGASQDKNWSYGNQIYVFNWQGKPIRRIYFDRIIYALGVSRNNQTLYSYDMETGQLIYSK